MSPCVHFDSCSSFPVDTIYRLPALREDISLQTCGATNGEKCWPHGVSNHRRLDCLLSHLFRRRSKKLKLRVTGLCEANPPVDSPNKGPVTRKLFDDVIMDRIVILQPPFHEVLRATIDHHSKFVTLFQYPFIRFVVPIEAENCMMASSNGIISALLAQCAAIDRSPLNSSQEGQRRGALIR